MLVSLLSISKLRGRFSTLVLASMVLPDGLFGLTMAAKSQDEVATGRIASFVQADGAN